MSIARPSGSERAGAARRAGVARARLHVEGFGV